MMGEVMEEMRDEPPMGRMRAMRIRLPYRFEMFSHS